VALAVVVAAGTVLATPALGVIDRLRDLFQGAPPTPLVQQHFSKWNGLADAQNAAAVDAAFARLPSVVPTSVRGVLTVDAAGHQLYLWAAAASNGYKCWLIQIGNELSNTLYGPSGCRKSVPDRRAAIAWSEFPNVSLPSLRILFGQVSGDAFFVKAELSGGARVQLPVVEHYFLALLDSGSTTSRITAYDENGEQIAESTQGDVIPQGDLP
jgi:hypothetical protein